MKFDYPRRWRRRKLYKQWVSSSGLAPQDAPGYKIAKNIVPEIDPKRLLIPLLYTLLGAIIGAALTLLIIFITKAF